MISRRIKEWVISALFGGCVGVALVLYFTSQDKTLSEAKAQRDVIVEKVKTSKIRAKKLIKKIKIHQKQFKTNKKEFKKIIASAKDDNQIITAQAHYIVFLEKEHMFLEFSNKSLQEELNLALFVQDEALGTINNNLKQITGLTAKNKALKIGTGLGVTLGIIGGAVGGYFIVSAIK